MKKLITLTLMSLIINVNAAKIIEVNGEKFCEAKKDAKIAIKMTYEVPDYGSLKNKVLHVFHKESGEVIEYKFAGRSNGWSMDVFVNNETDLLPSHIGNLVARHSAGVSLFNGFDNLGNLIDEEHESINYEVVLTYRPWENCGATLLNPEKK